MPDVRPPTDVLTIDSMPDEWQQGFKQAMALGNITRIRQLGDVAKGFDDPLATYLLEQAALYDLSGLQKLLPSSPPLP